MHIIMMIGVGLVLFVCFYIFRRIIGEPGTDPKLPRYTKWFLVVWAIGAAANSTVGVVVAGFPVLTEVIVFVPVFGVPAAVAVLVPVFVRSRAR